MGEFDRPRSGGFKRSFNDGPREMHKAVCSDCGQECEVPFKPSKDRPVYCRDCFMKQKGKTPRTESEDKEESDAEESEDKGSDAEESEKEEEY